MPYPPIPNPTYLHLEPWPHVYRRGGWIQNVASEQRSPARRPMLVIPTTGVGAVESASSAIPWQCWDMPGFKECQQTCFKSAQSTNLSAQAQAALVDQCVATSCVTPCRNTLAVQESSISSAKATSGNSKGLLATIAGSPLNIAVVALVLVAGSMLLLPPSSSVRSRP
jgi:hypothetical protein